MSYGLLTTEKAYPSGMVVGPLRGGNATRTAASRSPAHLLNHDCLNLSLGCFFLELWRTKSQSGHDCTTPEAEPCLSGEAMSGFPTRKPWSRRLQACY